MDAMEILAGNAASKESRGRTSKFPVHHKYDNTFFLLLVGLMWLGILMGFVPEIIRHIQHPRFTYPWIIYVHGVVFVGWLCLLTTQILLVRNRKIALHRRLGQIGIYWAIALPIVGVVTAFIMDRMAVHLFPHFKPSFISVQYGDLVLFSLLAGSALVLRKVPAAHKRLMLLGTLCLVDAGFARWWSSGLAHMFGNGYWSHVLQAYLGNILLILALGAYDLVTRHRLHRAYAYGAMVAIGGQLLLVWLYLSPWWTPISFKLIGY